jgi:arginyl-tRNA--protein-N-Asp/Glu arginylyltransferase
MQIIKGIILDSYLAAGYYRWQSSIFTDNCCYDAASDNIVDVFWLRTNLAKVGEVKNLSIYRKNKRFSVSLTQAIITTELEELYKKYKTHITFNAPESVNQILNGNPDVMATALFDTQMITIRDGEKLIAASYFDLGKLTMMDIVNFYDPDYKKYSLSKYMMLLKMEYGMAQNMTYYYPGYIALNTTVFDYKIFPKSDAMEVLLTDGNWYPYNKFGKEGLIPYGFYATFELE